jgi:hypothetical protein
MKNQMFSLLILLLMASCPAAGSESNRINSCDAIGLNEYTAEHDFAYDMAISKRADCYYLKAKESGDTKYCERTGTLYFSCMAGVATSKNDYHICFKVRARYPKDKNSADNERDACLTTYAHKLNDWSVCKLPSLNEYEQKSCSLGSDNTWQPPAPSQQAPPKNSSH